MQILLNIKDSGRIPFFKMLENLDYITVIKEINNESDVSHISDLIESINDVKLHIQGKKELQSARELLNEL